MANGYTRTQSRVLLSTSWLALVPAIQAVKKKNYKCAAMNLAVLATSTNHWRNPVPKSLRQRIDQVIVRLAVIAHMLEASRLEKSTFYNQVVVLSLFLYTCSSHLHKKGFGWVSVLLHGMMHSVGSVGNYLLY